MMKSGLMVEVKVPFRLPFIPEMISASRELWGEACAGRRETMISFAVGEDRAAGGTPPVMWTSIRSAKSLIFGMTSSMLWVCDFAEQIDVRRFGGGHIDELGVDAQAVADLRDASPNHIVRLELLSQGVHIGKGKVRFADFFERGKHSVPADQLDFFIGGNARAKHIPDPLPDVIDVFRAVDGKRQYGDHVLILGPKRSNRPEEKYKA